MPFTVRIVSIAGEADTVMTAAPAGGAGSTTGGAVTADPNNMYTSSFDIPAGDYVINHYAADGSLLSSGLCEVWVPDPGFNDVSYQDLRNVHHSLNILSGIIANAGTETEQYDSVLNGRNYRAAFTGLDEIGNRGGVTLSNP